MSIDHVLANELVAMADDDERVRAELAADGSLFEGYHPRMEEVHRRNGERLLEIIEERGWPGKSLAGDAGATAAWLILQHAISMPALQRRGLAMLKGLQPGEVDPAQVAMLEDRIRVFEGKPQIYGTQYDWDEGGEMSPHPIEDQDGVNERRRAAGLPPLEENTRRIREDVARSRQTAPLDHAERRRAQREWAKSVGW